MSQLNAMASLFRRIPCLIAILALLCVPTIASTQDTPLEPGETQRELSGTAKTIRIPLVQRMTADAKPFAITLPTALQLAGANPADIALAHERLRLACAQLDRAKVMWLPTVNAGVDYFRQDGRIQDVQGRVFDTSKSSILAGLGPTASVAFTDAFYAPLAGRQIVRAREADVQTAVNDSIYAVAEAYFNVQQARGEAAGAEAAAKRALDLVRRTEQLAPALAPTVEINRARTELARRALAVEAAYERWQIASADLNRLLRLDPTTILEPLEAPHLQIELIDASSSVDELIPIGLSNRPELAAHQALVQATLVRLRQEKIRPLIPSLIVRGTSSATPGLSTGVFGGGINDQLGNFGPRNSVDIQAVWELQNLGLGNRAIVKERDAERRIALLDLLRTQDRVAAEVAQALARAQRAMSRRKEAEAEVEDAVETADKNLEGLGQTRRVGEQVTLVFRPQEAVAAVTALDQSYRDYYTAVADGNRAQFALYRALGHPGPSALSHLSNCIDHSEPGKRKAASMETGLRPPPRPQSTEARSAVPPGVEVVRPDQPKSPDGESPLHGWRSRGGLIGASSSTPDASRAN